jgi:hypothetical protein
MLSELLDDFREITKHLFDKKGQNLFVFFVDFVVPTLNPES